MSGIIEISTTVLGARELARKIKEADKPIPRPPKELKDKDSWIQCTLKNETQFNILLLGSYFDAGRYWEAPDNVVPFHQMTFSCCNDKSDPRGIGGGASFRLSLDDKHYYDFALGWSVPLLGLHRAGVAESSNPKDGYDAAHEKGGSIESKHVFEGKDKAGHPIKFRIHLSAAPGQETLYVVKQVLID